MDLKKQVQLIHALKNDNFLDTYFCTRTTHSNSLLDECDILFNEVTFQPHPFMFETRLPTPHHPQMKYRTKAESWQLSTKEFEDCFIVDIT